MYQYELVKAATKLLRDNMGLKKGETVCITADTESHMDVVEATAQAAYALGGKPMVITFAAPRGVGKAAADGFSDCRAEGNRHLDRVQLRMVAVFLRI